MKEQDFEKTVGRYRVTRLIGRGGAGMVFLGHDPFIDRPVAIKTTLSPPPDHPQEYEKFKDAFFHEARAAGRLSHPNIVSVYDAQVDHDRFYLIMEYVDGVTLNASFSPSVVTSRLVSAIRRFSKGRVVMRGLLGSRQTN